MSEQQKIDAKNAADVGRCEANQSNAGEDYDLSVSALKKGMGVAALGVAGLGAGLAADSNTGALVGTALAGGGIGAMLVAGTRHDRAVRRSRRAEGQMANLQYDGITLPSKEAPYFVLPNGTKITPDAKYLERFINSEDPSSNRGR